ncbi:MAG: P-loop NTPase [Thermodesulfobacteriota bacterium]|nr:P-loop NTPase [Thermodesulfobacteriota bacterium]
MNVPFLSKKVAPRADNGKGRATAGLGRSFPLTAALDRLKTKAPLPRAKKSPSKSHTAKRPAVPRHSDFSLVSPFTEAFNTLRANIRFTRLNHAGKAFLITGAAPQEGKTTIAVNFAESLAFSGQKVLLIEGDLRLARFYSLFSTNPKRGLSSLVAETLNTPVGKGALGSVTLGDLMTLIDLQEMTGALTVSDNGDAYRFSFEMGRLVSSAWKQHSKEKHLVATLVKSGSLTLDQAREAVNRTRQFGQQLPLTLLNMRVLSADHLKGPLRLQILDTLGQAANLSRAKYCFKKASRVEYERGIIEPIPFGEILADGLPGLRTRPFISRQIAASITKKTGVKNLHVLPAGPTPPNPSEMLGSRRMAAVMGMLKEASTYDVLVIDSPPVTSVSDAAILSAFADGIIVVVRAGGLNRAIIQKAIDQLKQVDAPVLGFVLNRMNPKEEKCYYSHYYKYGYHDYYYRDKNKERPADRSRVSSSLDGSQE